MKIAIAICADTSIAFGGATTYVAHLYESLVLQGHDVDLVRLGNRTSLIPKDYVLGLKTISMTSSTMKEIYKDRIIIIAISSPEYAPIINELQTWKNTTIVMHDPRGIEDNPSLHLWKNRAIIIRENNLEHLPYATYIPHPYVPANILCGDKTVFARSISRIDYNKHIEIMLDANRHLPKNKQIEIRGYENRRYTRFTIAPKYPEWIQGKSGFERTRLGAAILMRPTCFLVDLSSLKRDGGGTQYTFLEAIDMLSVCVIGERWFESVDEKFWEMRPERNCIMTKANGKDLADTLMNPFIPFDLKTVRDEMLKRHAPDIISHKYIDFFRRFI